MHQEKHERRIAGHVCGYAQRHEERQRSRRLRQHVHRIDDGVQHPAAAHDAEQDARGGDRRIGQNVHKADDQIGQDAFQIVAVGAARNTQIMNGRICWLHCLCSIAYRRARSTRGSSNFTSFTPAMRRSSGLANA